MVNTIGIIIDNTRDISHDRAIVFLATRTVTPSESIKACGIDNVRDPGLNFLQRGLGLGGPNEFAGSTDTGKYQKSSWRGSPGSTLLVKRLVRLRIAPG